jgi:hypothetical protein
MSQISHLLETQRDAALQDAVQRKSQAVLSIRLADGWSSYKTQFLPNPGSEDLCLEYPTSAGLDVPELTPGQILGVSFRRGHKKCMFSSRVLRRTNVDLGGAAVPALIVARPQELQQLQRRAYNRVEVPPGRSIPIEMWDGGLSAEHRARGGDMPVFHGIIVDISAGGLSVLMPAVHDPRLGVGDTVGCRFRPDPQAPALALDANFRYASSEGKDQVRLGFQIVGLEVTPEGAAVLQILSELVSRLARAANSTRY